MLTCGLLGALPVTASLLADNDPDALLAAPVMLLGAGLLGLALALPALAVTVGVYVVEKRRPTPPAPLPAEGGSLGAEGFGERGDEVAGRKPTPPAPLPAEGGSLGVEGFGEERRPAPTAASLGGVESRPAPSRLGVVAAAFAALLGSVCCGLVVPALIFLQGATEARTEFEVGDVMVASLIAFPIASSLGAVLAGVAAWWLVRRLKRA